MYDHFHALLFFNREDKRDQDETDTLNFQKLSHAPWRPNGAEFELFFSHKLAPLKIFMFFEPLIFDKYWLANVRTDVGVPDGFSRHVQV